MRNELLIDCRTEDNAVKLVTLLIELQKGYREPYPWMAEILSSSDLTSKEIYEQLDKDFKVFEIMSSNVYYGGSSYTKDAKITFSYPNIIITYYDIWEEGVVSLSRVKPGKYTVKIPIDDCIFSSGQTYINHKSPLRFTSTKGIEIIFDNKVNLEPRFELMISGLGAEKICNELKDFQSKILSEGFKGSYGINKPTNKKTTKSFAKPKNILNKYEE